MQILKHNEILLQLKKEAALYNTPSNKADNKTEYATVKARKKQQSIKSIFSSKKTTKKPRRMSDSITCTNDRRLYESYYI